MPRVSKVPVEKKKMDRFLDDFWEIIASLETKREAREFLYDLLTHTEQKMLAKRLQIAVMLTEGCDYQVIKDSLKVSDTTIAKINNWLNTGAIGLIKAAKKLAASKPKGGNEQKRGGKYLAGDLLMPALEEGMKAINRRLEKKGN